MGMGAPEMSAGIRIFLCDDVPELRALLRFGLEEDSSLRVVGEAGDARSAVDQAGELEPDVVLLDLSLPGLDGLEAIPLLRAASPSSGILVFSAFSAERMAATALEHGADRYLEKGESLERVRAAVHEVHERRAA